MTKEEKILEEQRCQSIRDEWENANLGGYEKLYPLDENEEDIYKQYINEA